MPPFLEFFRHFLVILESGPRVSLLNFFYKGGSIPSFISDAHNFSRFE